MSSTQSVLIVGAGVGLSAALARLCHSQGMRVGLAARNVDKLAALSAETSATTYSCDVQEPASVEQMFEDVHRDLDTPNLVIYNPSFRTRGPLVDLDPAAVKKSLEVTCYGAFLVAQMAAKAMLQRGSGSIFFTGASAGVKGYPLSAPFAMGKFGLRGLAQSMARELHPKNIHIGHFVIDGGIRPADSQGDDSDRQLDADAIALNYLQLHQQHRSCWAWEIELRPWVESF